MATTYTQMVQLVRDWSNRDSEALPDNIIQDCLRWAADKAYRTLRVPPLEKTVYYNSEMLAAATSSSNNRQASVTSIGIPTDLIEFIHIRGVDTEFRTTRMFNEKADIRTFWDRYAEKYSDLAVWARQGDQVLLAPGVGSAGIGGSLGVGLEDAIELYYYSRLPALNATYEVSAENYNTLPFIETQGEAEGSTSPAIPGDNAENGFLRRVDNDTDTLLQIILWTPIDDTSGNQPFTVAYTSVEERDAAAMAGLAGFNPNPNSARFVGLEVPHWLRDENERVLLMGALAEVFFYLQENDEAQKYAALFQQEIAELNNEDVMRNASGGNVQVNFNGRGLI